MTGLRITYGPWGETLQELRDASRAAEAAGAEVVWFPEMHRSATVTAATVAQDTSSVGIGTSIALAFVRSPMITALEAMDIDEIANGRFRLGLGSGVQRLNEDWHHSQWGKPVAHVRESVAAIREVIARCASGEQIVVEGEWEPVKIRGYQRPFFQQRTSVPIYLAGVGPVMTRLAGEIGEGFISHELCSPAYLEQRLLPRLTEGLERAGRDRESLDVVVSACCAIDDDPVQARRWAAGLVGFYASVRSYADFFDFHGLAVDQQHVVDVFRGGRAADDLADAVTEPMVEALTLAGTPDEVRARLDGYTGLADTLKLTPPTHGLDAAETRAAQGRILELIADVTGGKASQ